MKKRGRKAQSVKQEDILNNIRNSKQYDKIIRKIIDFNFKDFDAPREDKVRGAELLLEVKLKDELLNSYASKGEANAAVSKVVDRLTMTNEDIAVKIARKEAKENAKAAGIDFDFRTLNKKQATFTKLDDSEIDPNELQSTSSSKKVTVEGYYDFGNGYCILQVIVDSGHGSPITSHVLASSDILGRIHNAV